MVFLLRSRYPTRKTFPQTLLHPGAATWLVFTNGMRGKIGVASVLKRWNVLSISLPLQLLEAGDAETPGGVMKPWDRSRLHHCIGHCYWPLVHALTWDLLRSLRNASPNHPHRRQKEEALSWTWSPVDEDALMDINILILPSCILVKTNCVL